MLEPLHISEGGYFEGHSNDQQKGKCIYHYRLSEELLNNVLVSRVLTQGKAER